MSRGQAVLVTGSCGLIGSEVTRAFARLGFSPTGIERIGLEQVNHAALAPKVSKRKSRITSR